MNRQQRRKNQNYLKKISKENETYINDVITRHTARMQGMTEQQKVAYMQQLPDEEKKVISNAATYIRLKALTAYAGLTDQQRQELQKGNTSVL